MHQWGEAMTRPDFTKSNSVLDPTRHSISLTPSSGHAERDAEMFASLFIIERLTRRMFTARNSGSAIPAVAMAGPAALGVMTGTRRHLRAPVDLIVAHGTKERIGLLMRQNAANRTDDVSALQDTILDRATYLNLAPNMFQSLATSAPAAPLANIAHIERGHRIMLHAAMRSATVSRVRILRNGNEHYVELPLLPPDGLLYTAIAKLGRMELFRQQILKTLAEPNSLGTSDERRRGGEAHLAYTTQQSRRLADELMLLAPDLLDLRPQQVFVNYRAISDPIAADQDASLIIRTALSRMPSPLGIAISDALGAIETQAIELQRNPHARIMGGSPSAKHDRPKPGLGR